MVALFISALLIINPISFDSNQSRATINVSSDVSRVSFKYALSDGTAIYGTHYAGKNTGSIHLGKVGRPKKIKFNIVPNIVYSPDRTFTLKMYDISKPGFPDTVYTEITLIGDYNPIVIVSDTVITFEGAPVYFTPVTHR